MAGKEKKIGREIPYNHREDAEWLSAEICAEFRKKAERLNQDNSICVGARAALCKELIDRCDISELQALNIINGYHATDYIVSYNRMRERIIVKDTDYDYLEWLAEKDINEKANILGDFGIEED